MTKPKPKKKDDIDDSSTPTTNTRPPPILEKQEARLPVLRIRRIKPDDAILELGSENNVEENEEANFLKLGPSEGEGPSPPQLDKCIEDDNVSVTSSSTTATDDKRISRSSQRQKNSTPDPKRLIQSIFAKPKKEKSKKRKASGKSKKSVKPTNQYLRIKIAPVGFGRRQAQTSTTVGADDEESENGDDGGIMDVDDVDQSCSDTGGSGRKLRSRGRAGHGEEDDSEEDGDDKGCDEEISGTRSQEGAGDETNVNDRDSGKKSDDDDAYADRDREHEWKPVRAAMVAAMELVAKKQVTEDMRTERRIRKQISKPLPPRGRGRRAIFKRLNKPVKSYEHTTGSSVTDTAYYDNTFFNKGDIVCLIQDMCAPRHLSLDSHRFFQINGFLKVPTMDDCVSLSLLKRVVPVPELKPRPDPPVDNVNPDEAVKDAADEEEEFPYRFNLMDYMPANSSEVMVIMSQLKFVMRCPPDFYYGHDIIFFKPFLNPGRIYSRLGRDVYEYDEEKVSERRLSSSDNDNDESSSSPPSITQNNNSNCNSVKGDDNESVVSSTSNSNNSNTSNSNGGGESSTNLVPAI